MSDDLFVKVYLDALRFDSDEQMDKCLEEITTEEREKEIVVYISNTINPVLWKLINKCFYHFRSISICQFDLEKQDFVVYKLF